MTVKSNTDHHCFRFHNGRGKSLTEEITAIETLATERLRAGVSLHSVQTGALVLLKTLFHEAGGQLVTTAPSVPVYPPAPEQPRCAAQERG